MIDQRSFVSFFIVPSKTLNLKHQPYSICVCTVSIPTSFRLLVLLSFVPQQAPFLSKLTVDNLARTGTTTAAVPRNVLAAMDQTVLMACALPVCHVSVRASRTLTAINLEIVPNAGRGNVVQGVGNLARMIRIVVPLGVMFALRDSANCGVVERPAQQMRTAVGEAAQRVFPVYAKQSVVQSVRRMQIVAQTRVLRVLVDTANS